MTTHTALIARLSAPDAVWPDREVDAEIAKARGWTFEKMKGDAHPYWRLPGETKNYMRERGGPPHYTGPGIDAALSLVPPHWQIYDWFIGTDKSSNLYLEWIGTVERRPKAHGQADSPAIALLIAIMQARALDAQD